MGMARAIFLREAANRDCQGSKKFVLDLQCRCGSELLGRAPTPTLTRNTRHLRTQPVGMRLIAALSLKNDCLAARGGRLSVRDCLPNRGRKTHSYKHLRRDSGETLLAPAGEAPRYSTRSMTYAERGVSRMQGAVKRRSRRLPSHVLRVCIPQVIQLKN